MTTEQRYQMFLDSVSDYAVFFTDREGKIVEWSVGAERVLGYSSEEAVGQNIEMIFAPETVQMAKVERSEAATSGQAVDERWHIKKGGVRFFAVGRLLALKDEEGKVQGYAKILRDWTEQKHAEDALRTSDQRFRAFFELAGSGNIEVDAENLKIVSANRRFCSILGYTKSELQSLNLTDVVHPIDRADDLDHIQKLKAENITEITSEKRYLRKNGEVRWLHEALTLLPGLDGPPHLFGVFQDITALKTLELDLESRVAERTRAWEEKNRQMEEMCYTVAHDLRAPLRSISGYAAVLQPEHGGDLTEREKENYIQRIQKSASHLDRLILDLLGYTRVEQMEIKTEPVSIDAALNTVLEELEGEIYKLGAEVKVNPNLGTVIADAFSLEHVLRNFLSNALKFKSPHLRPIIRIYSQRLPTSLRLTVEDNGIGVPREFAEKVFKMFEKLPTPQSHLGTGVGLAIVFRLTLRLGGKTGVEPNPGGGSRFWVELPIAGEQEILQSGVNIAPKDDSARRSVEASPSA